VVIPSTSEVNVKKPLIALVLALGAIWVPPAFGAVGPTVIVDDDGRASPPYSCDAPTPASSSIEAAVEAAPPGATVNVCPGTYVEQVSFETPDDDATTIRSLVRRAAVIQAPPTIAVNLVDEKSIVHVNGAQNVRILSFTIKGPGPTLCDSIRYGVWVENGGSATIDDNHITEIHDTPFGGCQNGNGIQVGRRYTDGPTIGSALITRNLIDRFQKNGITVDNTGSRATILGNVITGIGPTPVIAQNGVQISRGAYGVVRGNRISDHSYDFPLVFSSSGVILYGDAVDGSPAPGTTVAENVIFRNDDNIVAYGTTRARILDNRATNSTFYDGIYMAVDSVENLIEGNYLRDNAEHDCHDESVGPYNPPALVANRWVDNDGRTENRPGLCVGARGDDDDDAENDEDGDDDDHVHKRFDAHDDDD
jgi:nitrous oxidase accessory protein NosD